MIRRTLAVLLAASILAPLSACGEPPAPAPVPAGREDGVGAVRPKPRPRWGSVEASVVDRPEPGLAVIEARWRRAPDARGCALEILLPDGAHVLDGAEREPIDEERTSGEARWTVAFRETETADAVIRLCATTDGGDRIAEAAVRLHDAREDSAVRGPSGQ